MIKEIVHNGNVIILNRSHKRCHTCNEKCKCTVYTSYTAKYQKVVICNSFRFLENGVGVREGPSAAGIFTSPPSSSTRYLQTSRWPQRAAQCSTPKSSLLIEKTTAPSPSPMPRLFMIPLAQSKHQKCHGIQEAKQSTYKTQSQRTISLK